MADIFVATDGYDGNTGTSISDAYATLQMANDDAGLSAGDTVWLVVKTDSLGVPEKFSTDTGTITLNAAGTIGGGSIKWRATNAVGAVDGTIAVIDFAEETLTAGGVQIQAPYLFFQNISVENTAAGVTGEGWLDDNSGTDEENGTHLVFYGCSARNCGDDGFDSNSRYNLFYQCYAGDCSESGASGFRLTDEEDKHCFGCIAENCGQDGFNLEATASTWNCIANNNGAHGFRDPKRAVNCTSVNNTGSGIYKGSDDDFVVYMNNISYGNGAYGMEINPTGTRTSKWLAHNAFGNNDSGTYDVSIDTRWEIEIGTVNLTADPFVNSSHRNFALSGSTGGGALCRNAGTTFGRHTISRNFLDIGAVQSAPRSVIAG